MDRKCEKFFVMFLGFFFIAYCVFLSSNEIFAGGADKELTGNRGYLKGSAPEAVKGKGKEKIEKVKHRGATPETIKEIKEGIVEKHKEILEQSREAKEKDSAVSEEAGIGPRGYLVGTPKEKIKAEEKKRGKGGFVRGFDRAMNDLKEFNAKFKSKSYSDKKIEGVKGNYIYGEPPAEKPEPDRELARTRGMKPIEILPLVGRGIENLHKTWTTQPHRSQDKEIWGFRFPDMPKEAKQGINKHRGDPAKTMQSFIGAVGADIEKHKAAAPADK